MGDKSEDLYKAMNIVNYETSDSSHTLTSRTGLVALAELLKRLELNDLIERLMPSATVLIGPVPFSARSC